MPLPSSFQFPYFLPFILLIFAFNFPPNSGQSPPNPRFAAGPHNILTFPNPRSDNKTAAKCHLEGILTGQLPFFCDPDEILSAEEKAKLNGQLAELAETIEAENGGKRGECGWGIYLGIAIVNQQFYSHFQKESAENILRHKWSFDPRPKCQRTAQLILVAKNCQEEKECLFASMDSSLALALPKEELTALIGHQNALLRKGHFGQSLSNIVDGIQRLSILRIRIFSGKSVSPKPIPFPLQILAFLLILIIWEFGKMSIKPKLGKWLEARKMKKERGKKGNLEGAGRDGAEGNAENGQLLPPSKGPMPPKKTQIEIEMVENGNNGGMDNLELAKEKSRPFSKPHSSLQIYQVEENC